jgi:hypothetical protein
MSSHRATPKIVSLVLALSITMWAQCGVAMISAASQAPQCHARMLHAHRAASAMPCCPSRVASAVAHLFDPPPCCDLSSLPARPLASALIPGKVRSGQFSANGVTGTFVPPQRDSNILRVADSPAFVKPVFDLKTDLRI